MSLQLHVEPRHRIRQFPGALYPRQAWDPQALEGPANTGDYRVRTPALPYAASISGPSMVAPRGSLMSTHDGAFFLR